MTNAKTSVIIPSEYPIFIFASGQRCGSTLLQRILNSCPEILIWGEQHGHLNGFLREYRALLQWEAKYSIHRKIFLREGYDNFVANMVPEDEDLKKAATSYILALFGTTATKYGKSIWGFKEVCYDAQVALFLQQCFPKARFIHLTRNIVDCFISLKHWENEGGTWNRRLTEMFIEDWKRVNASFQYLVDKIPQLLYVKYEDMVSDPKGFIETLSWFLGMEVEVFDSRVFIKRLHRTGLSKGVDLRPKILPSDLNAEERALLSSVDIVEIGRSYGYEIQF
jgi:hypothetical protein